MVKKLQLLQEVDESSTLQVRAKSPKAGFGDLWCVGQIH